MRENGVDQEETQKRELLINKAMGLYITDEGFKKKVQERTGFKGSSEELAQLLDKTGGKYDPNLADKFHQVASEDPGAMDDQYWTFSQREKGRQKNGL